MVLLREGHLLLCEINFNAERNGYTTDACRPVF